MAPARSYFPGEGYTSCYAWNKQSKKCPRFQCWWAGSFIPRVMDHMATNSYRWPCFCPRSSFLYTVHRFGVLILSGGFLLKTNSSTNDVRKHGQKGVHDYLVRSALTSDGSVCQILNSIKCEQITRAILLSP